MRLLGMNLDDALLPGNGLLIDLDKAPPHRGALGQVTRGGQMFLDMKQLDDAKLFQATLLHETAHWAAFKKFGDLQGSGTVWPGLQAAIDSQANTYDKLIHLRGVIPSLGLGDGYVGFAAEQLQYGRVETWAHCSDPAKAHVENKGRSGPQRERLLRSWRRCQRDEHLVVLVSIAKSKRDLDDGHTSPFDLEPQLARNFRVTRRVGA